MQKIFNDILSKELIFLLKYLEGKRKHCEKFDQIILNMNGFEISLEVFMNEALSLSGSLYLKTIKKTERYYKLELTNNGIDILKYISYDKVIFRKSSVLKFIELLYRSIDFLIIKPLKFTPTILKLIFSNSTAKIILFIAALAGGIVAIIQLYNWYITGKI